MPQPVWENASRELLLVVTARDASAGTTDSLSTRLRIDLQPTPPAGTLSIRSRADTLPARPATLLHVDHDGHFVDPLPTPTCPGASGDLSPLQARMILPRAARSWPVRDSLAYDTCVRGVRARVRALVTWPAPSFDDARQVWAQTLSVSGWLVADSSRALPMRLRGELSGHGTLELSPDKLDVLHAAGELLLDLSAESSLKSQRVTQRVAYEVPRRP